MRTAMLRNQLKPKPWMPFLKVNKSVSNIHLSIFVEFVSDESV